MKFYEIAEILEKRLRSYPSVKIWLESTAVGVFADGIVGVVRRNTYYKIKPSKILVATGAREKMLSFPGNTLPGVYGAGAFQTLVNRDLVKSADRVLIVGGGNVGLIAGYHAIQAGIEVAALVEALPEVGGYRVHSDKLHRLGVPIYTGHTVVAANGRDHVESVTIAALDDNWTPIQNNRLAFNVDTLLIAVGLAITLVDFRKDQDTPTVTLPYEIWRDRVKKGQTVPITDKDGAILGRFPVQRVIKNAKKYPGTLLVQIKIPKAAAKRAIGVWVQEKKIEPSDLYEKPPLPDEAVVCRCERITTGEIRTAIRNGSRDINQLKALNRAGMGACGSKTCRPMIWRIFQEEGVDLGEVTDRVDRPLFVEVPLGILAGLSKDKPDESL